MAASVLASQKRMSGCVAPEPFPCDRDRARPLRSLAPSLRNPLVWRNRAGRSDSDGQAPRRHPRGQPGVLAQRAT